MEAKKKASGSHQADDEKREAAELHNENPVSKYAASE